MLSIIFFVKVQQTTETLLKSRSARIFKMNLITYESIKNLTLGFVLNSKDCFGLFPIVSDHGDRSVYAFAIFFIQPLAGI